MNSTGAHRLKTTMVPLPHAVPNASSLCTCQPLDCLSDTGPSRMHTALETHLSFGRYQARAGPSCGWEGPNVHPAYSLGHSPHGSTFMGLEPAGAPEPASGQELLLSFLHRVRLYPSWSSNTDTIITQLLSRRLLTQPLPSAFVMYRWIRWRKVNCIRLRYFRSARQTSSVPRNTINLFIFKKLHIFYVYTACSL